MPEELRKKTIHDLREIAQSFGVSDIFEKDSVYLEQEIKLKQKELIPHEMPLPEKPEYDARLMTAKPAERGDMKSITDLLEPHIKRGLKIRFDEESWYMSCGKKNDSGTIRMPLRDVLACAVSVMK